jgi:hypothetical protein
VELDRAARTAIFSLPRPASTAALLHPYLAAVAAVASYWLARESFHAGAFVADGGVWGVLGPKGAGKSSLLAALARAGVPIVCDDMLVLDGMTALAGPRSVDLRPEAAERLGAGRPLGVLGGRERWRVQLAPVAPELPLRGWITLGWGPCSDARPVKGSARLAELLRHRALRVPSSAPRQAIALSSRPLLEFVRPKRWSELDGSVERLLKAVVDRREPGGLEQGERLRSGLA